MNIILPQLQQHQ